MEPKSSTLVPFKFSVQLKVKWFHLKSPLSLKWVLKMLAIRLQKCPQQATQIFFKPKYILSMCWVCFDCKLNESLFESLLQHQHQSTNSTQSVLSLNGGATSYNYITLLCWMLTKTTHIQIHTQINIHTPAHTHTYTYIHRQTPTHTPARTPTTPPYTHTHTHTNVPPPHVWHPSLRPMLYIIFFSLGVAYL